MKKSKNDQQKNITTNTTINNKSVTKNGSSYISNPTKSSQKNITYSNDNNTIPHLSSFEKRIMMKNSTENESANTTNSIPAENHTKTESNINTIISNTEKIKLEICDSSKLINSSIHQLEEQINEIKSDLKNLTEKEKNENELIMKFTVCINNVNLIKADLIKINDILETLKKANCKHFEETQKKFDATSNLVNKLVTNIQNFIRTKNLNINLVILS